VLLLDVFQHAKIVSWHRCNADNFKTQKANYADSLMLETDKTVHRMIKYVGENWLEILNNC